MGIPNSTRPLFLGAAGAATAAGGYTISRSLRFNSADSAYLNRTPASAGNRRTWTWSGWVKRSKLGSEQVLFLATAGTNPHNGIWFASTDQLIWTAYDSGYPFEATTTQVFRDTSAWYHIVGVFDSANATSSDRLIFYINGVRITQYNSFSAPALNYEGTVNDNTRIHKIGDWSSSYSRFFNGYLADVHFIDGQALDPTSFGEFDATTGVWNPIEYTGSYGTNGFHLDFADNSSAAALGYDAAGSNDWTVNNLVANSSFTGFKTVTYTGNSSTQTISGFGFSPDLLWIKSRSAGYSHRIYDTIRGTADALYSDLTVAEGDSQSTNENLTAFTSDGFSLGTTSGINAINNNGVTFVAWGWDAGSSTVSNTDGSVTSSVRANQATGFSVVTWTGTGTGTYTVGHGLGAAPSFIITKFTSASSQWECYHTSLGNDYTILLNSSGAALNRPNRWNNTSPTSSVFTIGTDINDAQNVVAYCFAPKAGVSAFGSYTGNGSSTGPVVTTGFQPAFVMIKRTDSSGYHWAMLDSARGTNKELLANLSNAEGSTLSVSFTSNGFQVTTTAPDINGSGGTMIYMAFASAADAKDVDSLLDSATNGDTANDTGLGGELPGNYCTLNPLDKNSSATLTNGNLDYDATSGSWKPVRATIGIAAGKWYWETLLGPAFGLFGIATQSTSIANDYYPGIDATSYGYHQTGNIYNNGSSSSYGSSFTSGDLIGVAFDADNGKIWFSKNGTWQASGNPASGTNAAFTGINTGLTYLPMFATQEAGTTSVNFGSRAFAYTAPSGFKALCTANLPTPTIEDPSTVFETVLWQGDGTNNRKITTPFSPDFVWAKFRNQSYSHGLYDTVRGDDKRLVSNSDAAEGTVALGMESDGFVVEGSSSYNDNNDLFVAWTWDAGSSTVSNTDGSITSSVRANATAGFSIVTYTGNGTDGATIGHGLNAVPAMVITKNRSASWYWHVTFGYPPIVLRLNETSASFGTYSKTHTSTVLTHERWEPINGNGDSMVAYCFAPVAGYSAFDSYTGNGSSDGPFVYTGFRPKFLLVKNTAAANNWCIIDSVRNTYNIIGQRLFPNLSNAEDTQQAIDFLSNGFKIRNAGSSVFNNSGQIYIYAAFAESPFAYSRGR